MEEDIPRASCEEATAYLERYIKTIGTDFAIMIDGPWGSGKSYFVDNFLKTRVAKAKTLDPLDHRADFWYASFAGATDANAVYEQFFVSQHGKTGKVAVWTCPVLVPHPYLV